MRRVTSAGGDGGIDRADSANNGSGYDRVAAHSAAQHNRAPAGFDGLRALMRRQPMPPEAAATFGSGADSETQQTDGTTVVTRQRTLRFPPMSSPSILVTRLIDLVPPEAQRALVLGRTTALRDSGSDARVQKRSTWFAEVPARPTVKWMINDEICEYDPNDPAALKARSGVSMEPVAGAERAAFADTESVGISGTTLLRSFRRLSAEETALFGTDAMPESVEGADTIGHQTRVRSPLSISLPGLPFRKGERGVTVHVAELPPSADHPNGITRVRTIHFAEVPARRGIKVKLFERKPRPGTERGTR